MSSGGRALGHNMIPLAAPGETLQQRIDKLVRQQNGHDETGGSKAALISSLIARQDKAPVLSLPPPVAQNTRQFLPHHLPKSRPHSPTGSVVSREGTPYRATRRGERPSASSSEVTPADLLVTTPNSSGSAMYSATTALRGGDFGSTRPASAAASHSLLGLGDSIRASPRHAERYEGGGAMPPLLRPASRSTLKRLSRSSSSGATMLSDLAVTRRADSLLQSSALGSGRASSAHRRLRRLLPEDVLRAELSSSFPRLAYSSYRALDVFRGATSTKATTAASVTTPHLTGEQEGRSPCASLVALSAGSRTSIPGVGGPERSLFAGVPPLPLKPTAATHLARQSSDGTIAPPPPPSSPKRSARQGPAPADVAVLRDSTLAEAAPAPATGLLDVNMASSDAPGAAIISEDAAATRVQSVARGQATRRKHRLYHRTDDGVATNALSKQVPAEGSGAAAGHELEHSGTVDAEPITVGSQDASSAAGIASEVQGTTVRMPKGYLKKRHAYMQPQQAPARVSPSSRRWRSLAATRTSAAADPASIPTQPVSTQAAGTVQRGANPTFRGDVRRTNSKGTLGIVDIMRSFTSSRAIARALRKAPQFAQLNDAQIAMLAYGGEERRVPRYTVLYREGSVAHSFYVLLSGRLQQSSFHSTQKQVLKAPAADKVEGVCLGTEGLSGNMRRLVTATTLDECLILHFSTEGFHLDGEGLAGLAARASASVVTAALRGHSFFELLPEATLLDVAPLFRLEEVGQAGETVLQEGGPLDKMCLLLEGSVRLSIGGEDVGVLPDDGDEQEAIFGEAAFLSSAASVLSVVTLEPCKFLTLPRSKFRRAQVLMPDLREQLRGYSLLRMSFVEATLSARGSSVDAPSPATRLDET